MTNTNLTVTKNDVAIVRRTLYTLTATQKIVSIIVITATIAACLALVRALLQFGQSINYSGLQALGEQTVSMLQQYNPFFWWAVSALAVLILVYIAYGIVASTQRQVKSKIVSNETISRLGSQLSEGGREVLLWVWDQQRDPITVGVLQNTLSEMRSGRAQKISLARLHAQSIKPNN